MARFGQQTRLVAAKGCADALISKFCHALVSRRDVIVWDIGGPHQPPLPLERMARESPSTPQDVPLHPSAAAVWRAHGFLA